MCEGENIMDSLRKTLLEIDENGPSYNKAWVQFIMDHFHNLVETAEKHTIELGEMFRYRYRPEDYMTHINRDISLTWIMLLINQIPGRAYFNNLQEILVPSIDYIYELKEKFNANIMLEDNIEEVSLEG